MIAAHAGDVPGRAPMELQKHFAGRPVMVTGGAGFIGSNLAHRLVSMGARVTIVDSLRPDCGGNLFNLEGTRDQIWLRLTDLRDQDAMRQLVAGQEIIFNLAGQVSHEDSMRDPLNDLESNCRSHLCLLEACRRDNPDARIVLTSTRQVYGRPRYVPVDEHHPPDPVDVNGVNKLAGEHYHLLYGRAFGLWTAVLRLTNTYGPRLLIRHARQGFIAAFLAAALRGGEIQVFGDGRQQRDLTYVDDVVDALLLASVCEAAQAEVFNLSGQVTSLLDLARTLAAMCPPTSYRTVPFPEERRRIDIGSCVANATKIQSTLGWMPRVPLEEGLRRTLEYYRKHEAHYH